VVPLIGAGLHRHPAVGEADLHGEELPRLQRAHLSSGEGVAVAQPVVEPAAATLQPVLEALAHLIDGPHHLLAHPPGIEAEAPNVDLRLLLGNLLANPARRKGRLPAAFFPGLLSVVPRRGVLRLRALPVGTLLLPGAGPFRPGAFLLQRLQESQALVRRDLPLFDHPQDHQALVPHAPHSFPDRRRCSTSSTESSPWLKASRSWRRSSGCIRPSRPSARTG